LPLATASAAAGSSIGAISSSETEPRMQNRNSQAARSTDTRRDAREGLCDERQRSGARGAPAKAVRSSATLVAQLDRACLLPDPLSLYSNGCYSQKFGEWTSISLIRWVFESKTKVIFGCAITLMKRKPSAKGSREPGGLNRAFG